MWWKEMRVLGAETKWPRWGVFGGCRAGRHCRCLLIVLIVSLCAFGARGAAGLPGAVAGIDFGSENVRVAVVKTGSGVSVAVDEHSKRESPAVVAFVPVGDGGFERQFGHAATAAAYGRWSEYAVRDVRNMLEWREGESGVHRVGDRCGVQLAGHRLLQFTDLEVNGMLLQYAKRVADNAACADGAAGRTASPETHRCGDAVRDVVLTVPAWFHATQRGALVGAARVAGLKVLGLITANTAAAVQYAMDRRVQTQQPQHVLLVRMGARGITASVVRFRAHHRASATESAAASAADLSVEVLAHAWNAQVGGRVIDQRVADGLLAAAGQQLAVDTHTWRNDTRLMARLLREAQRAKEVLSVNTDTVVHLDSVLNSDRDVRVTLTRAQLEAAARDVFDAIQAPIREVLHATQLPDGARSLDAVIPLGGGTRMPRVQQEILRATGRQALQRSLNAAEAAVTGAGYYAASLSPMYRVRGMAIHEALPHAISIGVQGDRQRCSTLFGRFSRVPGSRRVTVNAPAPSMHVVLYEGESQDRSCAALSLLSRYRVMAAASGNDSEPVPSTTTDKVSMLFDCDALGQVRLVSAEAVPEGNDSVAGNASITPGHATSNHNITTNAAVSRTGEESKRTTRWHVTLEADAVEVRPAPIAAAEARLRELDRQDAERRRRARALNELEAYLLEAKRYFRDADGELGRALQQTVSTEQRQPIDRQIEASERWLDEQVGPATAAADIERRLQEMRALLEPVLTRAREHIERPRALQELVSWLRSSVEALRRLRPPHAVRNRRGHRHHTAEPDTDAVLQQLEEAYRWSQTLPPNAAEPSSGHIRERHRQMSALLQSFWKQHHASRKNASRGADKVEATASNAPNITTTEPAAHHSGDEQPQRPQAQSRVDHSEL